MIHFKVTGEYPIVDNQAQDSFDDPQTRWVRFSNIFAFKGVQTAGISRIAEKVARMYGDEATITTIRQAGLPTVIEV